MVAFQSMCGARVQKGGLGKSEVRGGRRWLDELPGRWAWGRGDGRGALGPAAAGRAPGAGGGRGGRLDSAPSATARSPPARG
jgi:hypothetical protein